MVLNLREPKEFWVSSQDGTRLAVTEAGEGEPILLVPGLGYAAWSFVRQIGPLSASARVLAMDNRGVGRSDKPPAPYSIHQMADDAFSILNERDAAPATVVGTSMGGYVALSLAQRHPEAVKSLVLAATTSGGQGALGVPRETLLNWGGAAHLGAEEFARATMPSSFSPGWVEEHAIEFEELLALRLEAPTPIEAWRAQFEACAEFLQNGLPMEPVDQPTVIVHGTADRVVPYGNMAHVAQRLPQASTITMQDAGHLCWIERHLEFNGIVLDALEV
jgi:3-oxoadipate enol-lactonase